jgi:hypothetical protein
MSARVNLLPPQIAERKKSRRIAQLSTVSVAVVACALGGVYVGKLGDVEAARVERDDAQSKVTALQQQVAALDEYRQLDNRLATGNTLLAAAMADEVSWARVLNDLSLAFPNSGSMESLTAELADDTAVPTEGQVADGAPVASVVFTGYSVERFAPGVQSVLVDFENARGFFNSYFTNAATEERGSTEVTNFNGYVRLDEGVRTNRYVEGLPEEVTP